MKRGRVLVRFQSASVWTVVVLIVKYGGQSWWKRQYLTANSVSLNNDESDESGCIDWHSASERVTS